MNRATDRSMPVNIHLTALRTPEAFCSGFMSSEDSWYTVASEADDIADVLSFCTAIDDESVFAVRFISEARVVTVVRDRSRTYCRPVVSGIDSSSVSMTISCCRRRSMLSDSLLSIMPMTSNSMDVVSDLTSVREASASCRTVTCLMVPQETTPATRTTIRKTRFIIYSYLYANSLFIHPLKNFRRSGLRATRSL